jgi:hypothetical protein
LLFFALEAPASFRSSSSSSGHGSLKCVSSKSSENASRHDDSEESGVGHEEEEEMQQILVEFLSNITTPKVNQIRLLMDERHYIDIYLTAVSL